MSPMAMNFLNAIEKGLFNVDKYVADSVLIAESKLDLSTEVI